MIRARIIPKRDVTEVRIGLSPLPSIAKLLSFMANRIDTTFTHLREQDRKAFVAYVAGGDPNFNRSLEILHTLSDAGADIIELGIPFSDPMADGIVNQLAADRALKSGMSSHRIIDLIKAFRKTHDTPLVLFTYLNPVYAYGFEAFHNDAAAAGAKAGLASRTNTLFSVPMLMYMVYSAHGQDPTGLIIHPEWSGTSLLVGLAIIFAIEANAIWGKMLPAIASVRAVIISSFVLAIALKVITDLV